jgi:hypothetical protein
MPNWHGGDILIRLSFPKIAWTSSIYLFKELIVALDFGRHEIQ